MKEEMTNISSRLIDYLNEKLEQLEYYKRQINPVDMLHFIKEELLTCHDYMVKTEQERTDLKTEVAMLRKQAQELEAEITSLSQRPLAQRNAELEKDNLRLQTENENLLNRQRDLAEMGVFEDVMRHPRTV